MAPLAFAVVAFWLLEMPPERALRLTLGASLIVAIIVYLVAFVPRWSVSSARTRPGPSARTRPVSPARGEDEIRRTVVQILGGVGVLATFVGVWLSFLQSQEDLKASQVGQITERFARATDQLGSGKTEITLGGIYALERIAGESETHYLAVIEVLTAYVRANAHKAGEACLPGTRWAELGGMRVEMQAALSVLGRRSRRYLQGEDRPLILLATDLRRAHLNDAHLEGADLNGAYLEKAFLQRAHLEMAGLHNTCLNGAHLDGAYLIGAYLSKADLYEAFLLGAKLAGATLTDACLPGADLSTAEGLTQGQVDTIAFWDEETKLPPGLHLPERAKPTAPAHCTPRPPL
jgi:hypothetical protein